MTILKLDQNERSEGLSDWAKQAWMAMPDQVVWGYPKREPSEAQIASALGFSANEVILGNGSDELISTLLAQLPSGAPVIIPTPTFGFYEEQCEIWPVKSVAVPPTKNFSQDWEATGLAIKENPKGLVILVRPNNPTGEFIEGDLLQDLIKLADENDSLVLLDEAYGEFASQSWLGRHQDFPNLIVMRTFSKALGLAGLRVGYMVGSDGLIGELRARLMPFNVCGPALYMLEKAISPEAQTEVANYSEKVVENREKIYQQLLGYNLPVQKSAANFLMMRLDPLKADFAFEALKQQGVQIRRWTRPDWRGVIRISIPSELAHLPQVLAKVFDPELICFDVDGCLIDTEPSFDACIVAVCQDFGLAVSKADIRAMRTASGFNDDHILTHALLRRSNIKVALESVRDRFNAYYFGGDDQAGFFEKEVPFVEPGFLRGLGREVALVTGRNRVELEPSLPSLNLPEHVVISTIDTVSQGKPDPEGIERAKAKNLAQRVWMLGDNVDDILAAKNAQAVPIGVGPNRDALLGAGAAIVLENVNQLEVLL